MGDFFASLLSSIDNFLKLIVDFWKGIFKYIEDIITALVDWFSNVSDSVIDFIKDLPANVVRVVMDFLGFLLDLMPKVCEYCFSDFVPKLKFNFNFLMSTAGDFQGSLCYLLDAMGFVQALQTISCGISMWAFLRLVSFIRC
jgi:hypothetical protein